MHILPCLTASSGATRILVSSVLYLFRTRVIFAALATLDQIRHRAQSCNGRQGRDISLCRAHYHVPLDIVYDYCISNINVSLFSSFSLSPLSSSEKLLWFEYAIVGCDRSSPFATRRNKLWTKHCHGGHEAAGCEQPVKTAHRSLHLNPLLCFYLPMLMFSPCYCLC